MNNDLEHLRLLSIFHYVVAGLAAFFSCFALLYMAFGIAMAAGAIHDNSPAAPPLFVGWFFIVISLFFMAMGLGFATCLFLAGRSLQSHTRYTYCLVIAGLSCLFTPFGTVLGIFTLIVLLRPSVQELFGQTVPLVPPTSQAG
jgi:hypothetical protein